MKVRLKDTLLLWGFGLFKIPLLAFIRPRVVKSNEDACVIRIPYRKRNLNHVNSIYFGVLSSGADLAAGWLIINELRKVKGKKTSFVFQSSEAQFLRRAMANTDFYCNEGPKIRKMIDEAIRTGERVSLPIEVEAVAPQGEKGTEVVAKFSLVASIKIS